MRNSNILILAFAGWLGGCAFATHPPVVIQPELITKHSDVGASHAVRIDVTDERPSKTLGTRGVRGVGSEITIAGDYAETIRGSLSQALANQGFVPTDGLPGDGRELKVEIRDTQYSVTMGFWAGTLRTQCSLKAVCVVGNTRPFEKLYRGEHEESVQVVQSAEANQRYINDAVSKAVNELADDSDLIRCLATPVP